MGKKVVLGLLCALITAGSLTVFASADSLKRVDRVLYRYSDSGDNLEKYTGFAKSEDGRRHYYKKGVLVKEKWIKTNNGKQYYADKSGIILTGKKVIGNQVYSFDDRGRWNEEEPVTIDDNLGITFILKEQTDSQITANISLDKDFPFAVSYGEDYWLLKKTGKKWKEVKTIEGFATLDIAYEIDPGETVTINIPFQYAYGKLSEGKYRLVKSFDIFENEKKRTETYLTFTIQ